MYEHDYSQTDIYFVNVETKKIDRVTNTNHNESHPVWSKTSDNIFYTSDYNGVWNLFKHPMVEGEDSEPIPVTNVLTGLQQPTISGDDKLLIFAGYSGIGWDLYSMANPLALKKQTVNPTQFILNGGTEETSIADLRKHKSNMRSMIEESNNYSDYVFARGYEHFNSTGPESGISEELVSIDSVKVDGQYVPKAYKTRFTLDLVSGNLQISNVFGTSGMTYFAFSDILGDHQIAFGTEMVLTLENSDYFFNMDI